MSEHRPTIVLVHGAFANAGCWSKLIPCADPKGGSLSSRPIAR